MTLIAGATTWKGVCIGADTRATLKKSNPPSYKDDIMKIDITPGGFGIAVAGSCDVATHFRAIFIENISTNTYFDDSYEGAANVTEKIIKKTLQDLANIPKIAYKISKDTHFAGLVANIDVDVRLRLGNTECQQLIEVSRYARKKNSIWKKYSKVIRDCANNKIEYVEFEYPRPLLFSFESQIGSSLSPAILKIEQIPFGQLAAWGSGKTDNHDIEQIKTLGLMLIEVEPDSPDDSSIHLLRTHALSELNNLADPKFGFKTFGGGYLAGALVLKDEKTRMMEFRVSKGDYFKNKNGDLVCSVYERNRKLYVKTNEGKEWELKEFWNYDNQPNISLDIDQLENIYQ